MCDRCKLGVKVIEASRTAEERSRRLCDYCGHIDTLDDRVSIIPGLDVPACESTKRCIDRTAAQIVARESAYRESTIPKVPRGRPADGYGDLRI